jgi:hypothetical protein
VIKTLIAYTLCAGVVERAVTATAMAQVIIEWQLYPSSRFVKVACIKLQKGF